jgi:ribonuclease HI
MPWPLAQWLQSYSLQITADSNAVNLILAPYLINIKKVSYDDALNIIKAPTIIPLYHKAMSLIFKFNNIQFEWIPREQNKQADRLSNYAYRKVITDNYKLGEKISQ